MRPLWIEGTPEDFHRDQLLLDWMRGRCVDNVYYLGVFAVVFDVDQQTRELAPNCA